MASILRQRLTASALIFLMLVSVSQYTKADEDHASGKNSTSGQDMEVGDPISAANGSFRFDMPLFTLGGPMNLHFKLTYKSNDSSWFLFRTPNTFPSRLFSFSPLVLAGFWEDARTFILEDGSVVSFKNINFGTPQDPVWKLDEGSDLYPDNGQPVKYAMKDTADYVYLMDPVREIVYIFLKTTVGNNCRLACVTDRNGNAVTYQYQNDADNVPVGIFDGFGREINIALDGDSGNITAVTDHAGRGFNFGIDDSADDNGNVTSLRSVTDPMGNATTFQYQVVAHDGDNYRHNVAGIEYPEGNIPYKQRYIYSDALNTEAIRVDLQTDAYGNETAVAYGHPEGDDTYQATITNADTGTEIYEHHSYQSRPKSFTDAKGNKTEFEKNEHEQISAMTDRLGNQTGVTYHAESGKLASVTDAKGDMTTHTFTSQVQTVTNPLNAETVDFTYYNVTRIDHPDGSFETYGYDANGNMTEKTDGRGKTWTNEYDGNGFLTRVTRPTGGVTEYDYNPDKTVAGVSENGRTTTYGYDTYKRVSQVTYPNGSIVAYTYDLNDRILTMVEKDHADDAEFETTTFAYDKNGNMTSITDTNGNDIVYTYNLMDKVESVTDKRDSVITYGYDEMNRAAVVTDPLGSTTQFAYNTQGQISEITNAATRTWLREYGKEGLIASETTPMGRTSLYRRDHMGRLTAMEDPLGGTTEFLRDDLGRVTKIIDPTRKETAYTYDGVGDLLSVAPAAAGIATYVRNDGGNLLSISDLNNKVWSFSYEADGTQSGKTDPLNNTWGYTFTGDTLTRIDYPGGENQVITLDSRDNVIRREFSEGPILDFVYTPDRLLKSADKIEMDHDLSGNVVKTTNRIVDADIVFTSTYDAGSNLKTVVYDDTLFTVTYEYNNLSQLIGVSDNLSGIDIDLTYNDDGELTGIARSNGIATTYTRNGAGRIIRQQDGDIIDIDYETDAAGRIKKIDYQTVPIDPTTLNEPEKVFSYNDASEISTAGFAYDERGRLTASVAPFGDLTYTWDGASRLKTVGAVNLEYNGLNDLVSRSQDGTTTLYPRHRGIDTRPAMAEKNADSGEYGRYYVWTPDGTLLYGVNPGDNSTVHYHFDAYTGSTLALTDGDGELSDAYAYSPYGTLLSHTGPNIQPFTFVGRYGVVSLDDGSTFYNMKDRFYDAYSGRFISRERMWPDTTNPLNLNPYQYANNNPVSLIDPLGLSVVTRTRSLFNKLKGVGDKIKSGAVTANEVKGLIDNLNSLQESAEQLKKQLEQAQNGNGLNDALEKLKDVVNTIEDIRGALEGAAASSEYLANALKGLNLMNKFKGLQGALGKFGQAASKFSSVAGKIGPALTVAQGLVDFARASSWSYTWVTKSSGDAANDMKNEDTYKATRIMLSGDSPADRQYVENVRNEQCDTITYKLVSGVISFFVD
jgi:RHS repeat-associated protein